MQLWRLSSPKISTGDDKLAVLESQWFSCNSSQKALRTGELMEWFQLIGLQAPDPGTAKCFKSKGRTNYLTQGGSYF